MGDLGQVVSDRRKHRESTPKRWLIAAGALAALGGAPPRAAHAYSDPVVYADPIETGGGAGRWFTGSPAEGYGCEVCHEGGEPVGLEVQGLPVDGYVPGTPYPITLRWPATAQHVALVAEFSDALRAGAGTVSLPDPSTVTPADLCTAEGSEMLPPSAVHEGEENPFGLPRRMFFTVIDCGAAMARFTWTAPATPMAEVWFSAGFVHSNADTDPGGDGVTVVSLPLSIAGSEERTTMIAQGCSAAATHGGPGDESSSRPIAASVLGALALIFSLRRQRRGEARAR